MIGKIKRILLYLFLTSFLYVLITKFVDPPITVTQLTNAFGLGLKRDYVSWEELGYQSKLAAIASEDQLFAEHIGFDFDAIEKSLRPKKKKKKSKIPLGGGASTITQQVAKNDFLWQGGSYDKYIRKIPEIYFTFLIELIWGKKRILEVYLNIIEMGKGIYGAEAAANFYYNKSANELSKNEAASIVACFPNPRRWTANKPSKYIERKQSVIVRYMKYVKIPWKQKSTK